MPRMDPTPDVIWRSCRSTLPPATCAVVSPSPSAGDRPCQSDDDTAGVARLLGPAVEERNAESALVFGLAVVEERNAASALVFGLAAVDERNA